MMAVDIGGHNRQQSNWNVWSSSVIQLTLYMYVYILYMSFYPYHCLYAVSLWERMDLAPYFFTYTLVAITCIFCSFSYTTYTITKAKMWPIKNYKKKKRFILLIFSNLQNTTTRNYTNKCHAFKYMKLWPSFIWTQGTRWYQESPSSSPRPNTLNMLYWDR